MKGKMPHVAESGVRSPRHDKRTTSPLWALAIVCLLAAQTAFAQTDSVVMEIGGKPVYKSEFMREFLRSIGKKPGDAPTACTYEKRQALEEYVQTYANYRAKLADAFAKRYDKNRRLQREFKGYRAELAAPYLIDSATLQRLMAEAYERNHYVLSASHILVPLGENAMPADTLAAYNHALELRKRVTQGGEDFAEVAKEEWIRNNKLDDDLGNGTGDREPNDGTLGSFTVFDMVYPFESAAYALQVGQVSKPVRTRYGYHIIKLHGKTPYFNVATVQHIWISDEQNKEYAKGKVQEAYRQILSDTIGFAVVARNYSDDRSTSFNGGLIPNSNIHQLPPEYVDRLGRMKAGEVSEPFHTAYGWHILYLVKKDALPPMEEMEPYYRQKMAHDNRNDQSTKVFVEQCKRRYHVVDNVNTTHKVKVGKTYKTMPVATLDAAKSMLNDSVFRKRWRYRVPQNPDSTVLLVIKENQYTVHDFLKYLEQNQELIRKYDVSLWVDGKYPEWVDRMVLDYADSHLESEHPEFAALMSEYLNGLTIFSYNHVNVWDKAQTDSVGLLQFYQENSSRRSYDNPADSSYFWNERASLVMVTVADSLCIAPSKVEKQLNKALKKGEVDEASIGNKLSGMLSKECSAAKPVEVLQTTAEKGHQMLLRSDEWHQGVYARSGVRGYTFYIVTKVQEPTLKSLSEAKGFYMNDYQNFLDEQLIKSLWETYQVKIHQNVVDEITY
ncbi:MAG: peptidylprolyl isomerase [Bacteroidales bacterium]|nr:peptidylprolyl isomerase [Bacteroidales bacterium]